MTTRHVVLVGGVAALLIWIGVGRVSIAQSPEADKSLGPKTPWGEPDLQGIWSPGQ